MTELVRTAAASGWSCWPNPHGGWDWSAWVATAEQSGEGTGGWASEESAAAAAASRAFGELQSGQRRRTLRSV
jgi:hypothetical protein